MVRTLTLIDRPAIWVLRSRGSSHSKELLDDQMVYRHSDDIQRVRSFKRRVLLFKGEGSSKFLHEMLDILGYEFPDARVKMLPGGHTPQLGSMAEFIKILTSFLNNKS